MLRKARKITKMRGSKSCGGGDKKKRRGAGNRGGRGRAGARKHHWTRTIVKEGAHTYGKHGFVQPAAASNNYLSLNLKDLERKVPFWINEGKAEKKGDTIFVDITALGYSKVLGTGSIKQKLHIKAPMFSKGALSKIEAAGGVAELIQKSAETGDGAE